MASVLTCYTPRACYSLMGLCWILLYYAAGEMSIGGRGKSKILSLMHIRAKNTSRVGGCVFCCQKVQKNVLTARNVQF